MQHADGRAWASEVVVLGEKPNATRRREADGK